MNSRMWLSGIVPARGRAAGLSIAAAAVIALPACGGDGSDERGEGERARPEAPPESEEREAGPGREAGEDEDSAGGAAVGRAVVALERAGRVAVLAGPRWRPLRRVRVGAGPHNVAASPDGRFAAISSPPANEVTIVSRRGRIRSRTTVAGAPHDLAFTGNSRALWVTAERAGALVKLSVPGGRQLARVSTRGQPHDLRRSPRSGEVWTTINGSDAVEIRSERRGRLLGRARLGGAPHDLAFDPERPRVWFSNWNSGTLTVAAERSRRTAARLRAGGEPHHFAFGLGSLWVSDNESGAVLRIDPRRRRVVRRTRVGPAPHHVTVAGDQVLVAVHGSGRVAVLSRRGRLLRTVRVGAGPHGIAAFSREP